MAGYFREKQVRTIHFCGLALDFCVYFSMVDALKEGFKVVLHEDATRAIDSKNAQSQLNQPSADPGFRLERTA